MSFDDDGLEIQAFTESEIPEGYREISLVDLQNNDFMLPKLKESEKPKGRSFYVKHGDGKFDDVSVEREGLNDWRFYSKVKDSDFDSISLSELKADRGNTYTLYYDTLPSGTRRKFTSR